MAEVGCTKVIGSNGVVKSYEIAPHAFANDSPDGRISPVSQGRYNVTKGELIW
jgi:hypothetical protein